MKKLIFIILLFPMCYLIAENFIVKKKKTKLPSINRLKEQCCQELSSIMEIMPGIMYKLADIHQLCQTNIRYYVEGTKEGLMGTKSKETLANSLRELQSLKTAMHRLQQNMHHYCQSCQVQTVNSA